MVIPFIPQRHAPVHHGIQLPDHPTATKESLSDLYFQFQTLNMGFGRDQIKYYAGQAISILQDEGGIKLHFERHGNLSGYKVPGLDDTEFPVLDRILKTPLEELVWSMIR